MFNLLYSYGLYYVAAISAITFVLFGYDKWMARTNGWRIPESILWISALIGGSPGAIAAITFFRHKTQKISFQFILALIILLQAGAVFLISYFT